MDSNKTIDEYLTLHVRVYANRLYQQDRWRIFERRENSVKAASIVLGTASFAELKQQIQTVFGWSFGFDLISVLVMIFVIINVVALVFQWGAKARDAAKRSSDWTSLERDMMQAGSSVSPSQLNVWRARCAEIETYEPHVNVYLQERAFRLACYALDAGLPDEDIGSEGGAPSSVKASPLVTRSKQLLSAVRRTGWPWIRAIS